MTAVAVPLLSRPPAGDIAAGANPDAVEVVTDTDMLMKGCACSSSSDTPYN